MLWGGLSRPSSWMTAVAVVRLSIIGRNDAVLTSSLVASPIFDWATANVTDASYTRSPVKLSAHIVTPPRIAAAMMNTLARQNSAR